MANPITPNTLKGFVPSVTAKTCEALTKALLGFSAAVYRWYAWAFNSDGSASNALKQTIVPSGFIMANAGSNLTVTDWLVCNGQSVSKDTYPELYAAIGTIYGGNGAPNFMVPNLVDKFIIGVGENNLAATGGEKTHVLTAAEVGPSALGHTHVTGRFNATDNDDACLVIAQAGEEGPTLVARQVQGAGGAGGGGHVTLDTLLGDYSTTGPAIDGSEAAAAAHENRPPFLALNWFIKT